MGNLANTLFLRSLQQKDLEKQRQKDEDRQWWQDTTNAVQQLEAQRQADFERQIKLAESQGKLASMLGKERPIYKNEVYDQYSQIGADTAQVDSAQAGATREAKFNLQRAKDIAAMERERAKIAAELGLQQLKGDQELEREILEQDQATYRWGERNKTLSDMNQQTGASRERVANTYAGARTSKLTAANQRLDALFQAAKTSVQSGPDYGAQSRLYNKLLLDLGAARDYIARGHDSIEGIDPADWVRQRNPELFATGQLQEGQVSGPTGWDTSEAKERGYK